MRLVNAEIREKIAGILLMLAAFWVICYRLDAVPLKLWDESRQANNALEMAMSGNWLYPTYNGEPDFWNTKPQLLVSLQALCVKVLGPGLLAIRLPSALAGCLTVLVWFVFLRRQFGHTAAAVWVVVIICCGGFNVYHITRTGDYDALLTLFVSLANISLFSRCMDPDKRSGLQAEGIWISLAILTKSLAAVLWIPVWLLIVLAGGLHKRLNRKQVLPAVLIPLLVCGAYYGLREAVTPGYLQAVWDNEISGRYFKPNEGHGSPWWYYADVLSNDYFRWFIIALPLAFVIPGNRPVRRWLFLLLIAVAAFVVLLSVSKTRIWWYLAPVMPLLAFWVSLPLAAKVKSGSWGLLYLLGILAAAIPGYFRNFNGNTTSHGVRPELVLMQIEQTGKMPFQNLKWQVALYNPVENYYARVLAQRNIRLNLKQDFNRSPGDTVLVSHMEFLDSLGKRFHMRQLHYPDEQMPVWILRVDSVLAVPK